MLIRRNSIGNYLLKWQIQLNFEKVIFVLEPKFFQLSIDYKASLKHLTPLFLYEMGTKLMWNHAIASQIFYKKWHFCRNPVDKDCTLLSITANRFSIKLHLCTLHKQVIQSWPIEQAKRGKNTVKTPCSFLNLLNQEMPK